MSATTPLRDDVARSRDKLLEIRARCESDRYALFPRSAREILGATRAPRIVVFGTRGLGFAQQLDQIERVVQHNRGMDIAAIVDDEAEPGQPARTVRNHLSLTVDQFFSRTGEFSGCLVVDRSCTWHPGVRYKVRLKQNGFAFLRVEQFLNAPGLDVGAGYYREHSDLMLRRFDDFLRLETLWSDELSAQTYYYALAAFISMNHEYFAFHCGDYKERYFPRDVGLSFNEGTTYADCGAHDGQEAIYFARLVGGRFREIHAFEPDRNNYLKLSSNVNRLVAELKLTSIYCHEFGVYDRNAYLKASGYDAGVTIVDQAAQDGPGIHVCRLDDMIDELSHLRLEIEGAELAALNGARGLISRCRPSMAISAYHKPSDFLDIAAFLREVDLGYRMSVRHQSLEPGVLCVYCT